MIDPPAAPPIGVLLVNLGSPDAAEPAAVRRYLREFLSDPRVIEDQGLIWKFVLNAIILTTRPRRRARDYAKIWNKADNEAPLKTITRAQAQKLAASLEAKGARILLDWAMRYSNPAIGERIEALMAQGCDRLLVVPLYPQYAAATTATVADEVLRVLARLRRQPALRIAPPYYDDPVYIDALAASIHAHLAGLNFAPEALIASFHGMPQRYLDAGDPYHCQVLKTSRLLRERLGWPKARWHTTFQSRFGSEQWLQPYTSATVERLAKSGLKRLAIVAPGFAADCLETLEELGIENRALFLANGGENFVCVPCLNDSEHGMRVIEHVVRRELMGWVK